MTRVKNCNRVPLKVWNRWTDRGRRVFNNLFAFMLNNQPLFLHPKGLRNKREHWRTTCWNAAWIAADSASRMGRKPRVQVAKLVAGFSRGTVFARDAVLDIARQAWTLGYAARLDQEG